MLFDHTLLRARMLTAKVSQKRLALELGITPVSLRNKLSGQTFFKDREMCKIGSLLHIPPEDFKPYFFTLRVEKQQGGGELGED